MPLNLAFTKTSPCKGAKFASSEDSLERDKHHTHNATEAEACDWITSLMLPFTLPHPGLSATLPFQLAEFILLVTQDDFIYFKVLCQCYQDLHHLRRCLHKRRQKWTPRNSQGTCILGASPVSGLALRETPLSTQAAALP